ncbi:MAG: type II toxin-antitoxin system RelE/ParE family toxin [Hyphomonas sp.]|nr:type II toxin-antitoxin system RelE/ParE family toxin [Hyphomonas sp.]
MKLVISERAQDEYEAAFAYIYERNQAAALAFYDTVETAFYNLTVFPLHGREVMPGVRRLVLQTFPYLIFYRVTKDRIEIISIFASARNPDDQPDR